MGQFTLAPTFNIDPFRTGCQHDELMQSKHYLQIEDV